MTKPENKYRRGSIIWSVMEGDWEDLTVSEIAYVLNTNKAAIRDAIRRIRKETGYAIRYGGVETEESEEMTNSEKFTDRLQRMRKRNRLSPPVLGELCGLSKNLISLYENGARKPSLESVIALADYFDVSIDYLIGRADNPQRLL